MTEKTVVIAQKMLRIVETDDYLDYSIIYSGLFGVAFAQQAKQYGKPVLTVEKRKHISGNIYTEEAVDINVHRYGRCGCTGTGR